MNPPETPGLRLVRACLRWDAAGDAALHGLDEAGWSAVMDVVQRRDGQALLARRITRLPGLAVPGWVAEDLHRFRLDVAVRLLSGLARLGPAIAAAGVPVMALKGLDLGTRLYGDPGARPMGDIDILVQPAHVSLMAEALRTQGFRPSQAAQQPAHHLTFHPPRRGELPVELHWALGADDGRAGRPSLLEGIWDDALVLDVTGVRLSVMHGRRLLPYLCAHLENHLFETPLTHIWDIAELLEQETDGFDRHGFWAECERHGRRKAAEAALGLAATHLGIRTPAPPLPPHVQALLPDVVANLGRHPKRDPSEPSPSRALLADKAISLPERWRILRGIMLPPRRMTAAAGGAAGLSGYPRLWRTLFANHLRNRRIRKTAPPDVLARVKRRARLGRWLG